MHTSLIRLRRSRVDLLCGAGFAAAIGLGVPSAAFAQDAGASTVAAEAATTETTTTEDIVVTGTRVVRGGYDAPTPLTAVDSAQLGLRGSSNIGDLTKLVPSLTATITPASTASSSIVPGGNYFNLRNLGNVRTLVLVDSKRFVPTNATGQVDTNVIPSVLVDRIDVVTGGVSSAYGSDAVAGVVNIILKKDLEGFRGSLQYGETKYGDFKDRFGSAAYGTSFADGRGHFTIAGEYQDNGGGKAANSRPWQRANWGIVSNPTYTPTNGQFAQLIVRDFQLSNATRGGLITSGVLRGTQFGPGGAPQPFTYGSNVGSSFMSGGGGFNPGGFTSLGVPLERWNLYGRLSFEISSDVTAWADASYARSQGASNYVPPFNLGTVISANNAYLPTALKSALAAAGQTSFQFGRIGYDMGFLSTDATNKTGRVIGGLEGKFGDGWTWDTSLEYGENHFVVLKHDINSANYARAINAVINPATGQPVCASTLTNPNDGCIPINLFGEGSPSQAAINYVFGNERSVLVSTETAAAANIQGSPFSTWAGPVSVAVGGEYRRETVNRKAGPLVNSGAFLTGGEKDLKGDFDVVEAYVETVVPLLHDAPFAKALDFNGAVRVARYSTSGTETTWKAGLSYQVNDDLRFRATQSRDLRAPNIQELFSSGLIRFPTITNPANNQQLNITTFDGGNPNLKPEIAKTFTGGVVYAPSWLSGFQASVDYYHTKISGFITTLAAQDIVNGCAAGSTTLCSLITRDASNNPTSISLRSSNLAKVITEGVDFELSYRKRLSDFGTSLPGTITLRGLGTYVAHLTTDNGITSIDRAGDVGSDANAGSRGVPHWRGNVSLTYDSESFTAQIAERIIGGGNFNNTFAPGFINKPRVSGQAITDISFQYKLPGRFEGFTLYGSVLNLFNQAPPIDPQNFFVPNMTNNVLYDTIGQTFNVGIKVKL